MGESAKSSPMYTVFFSGAVKHEEQRSQTIEQFRQRFKLSDEKVEKVFSGKPVPLKKAINEEQANRFAAQLSQLGLICRVVPQEPAGGNLEGVKPKNLTLDDIDKMFDGMIEPVKVSSGYSLMLIFGAVLILLLPALYFLLTASVAAITGYHAVHNIDFLTRGSSGALGALFAYGGPVVVGSILVFFLLKPMLAPAQRDDVEIKLDRNSHRRFFRFVEQICQRVGSPVPSEIIVNHQVNASAGLMKGVFSRDLRLVVGMPLISGMSSRQLAGILAHEFGHFSQSWAMRGGYVMWLIIGWFHRAAFERDQWDYKLEKWSRESEWFGVMMVLHVTRGCIWLSRKVLFGFMYIALLVRHSLGRQMEFDADRYEARMSGSDHFISTTRRLIELSLAYRKADELNSQSWAEGRLVNNIPGMVEQLAQDFSDEEKLNIAKQLVSTKTGLWDTHPCDSLRIASAEKEQAAGIFVSDLPARMLFKLPEKLAERVTRASYTNDGFRCEEHHLITIDQQMEMTGRRQKSMQTLEDYWGRWFDDSRILPVGALEAVVDDSAVVSTLSSLMTEFRQQSPEYDEKETQIARVESEIVDVLVGQAWFQGGFDIDLESYGFTHGQSAVIARAVKEKQEQQVSLIEKQRSARFILSERLRLGLMLYIHQRPEEKDLVIQMVEALKTPAEPSAFTRQNLVYQQGIDSY